MKLWRKIWNMNWSRHGHDLENTTLKYYEKYMKLEMNLKS